MVNAEHLNTKPPFETRESKMNGKEVLRVEAELPDGEVLVWVSRVWMLPEGGGVRIWPPSPGWLKGGPPDWLHEGSQTWDHPQDAITYKGRVQPGHEDDARELVLGFPDEGATSTVRREDGWWIGMYRANLGDEWIDFPHPFARGLMNDAMSAAWAARAAMVHEPGEYIGYMTEKSE